VIEPTEEMDLALLREADAGPRAAVEAVLAIVERDYTVRPRRPKVRPQCTATHEDGTRCERRPHTAGLHVYADREAGDLVIW
jgi:hypothetical protein